MDLLLPSPARALRRAPSARLCSRCLPGLVGLLVAAAYASVALGIHHRLGTGMDLAIFDQGVRSLSHGHWPTSAMKSVGMNLWGDHFHPVVVLAAPLYWLWDDPRMLLMGQAAALGLGVAILVRAAQQLLPGRGGAALAALLGLGMAAAPGTQWAMVFDVHEVAFGVPLLALALAALVEARWRSFTLWSITVLLVKEDAGLLVMGLGLVAVVKGRRRLGAALAVGAAVWTGLVLTVIIPSLSPTGQWLYRGAVSGPWGSLHHASRALVSPGQLTSTMVLMLLATGLLALRSPLPLVLLPSLAARAISGNPAYWGISYHYNLLPSVVLAFAALDGMRRTPPPARRWAAGLVLVAVICCARSGAVGLRVRDHVDPGRLDAAREALVVVPPGAPVAADVFLTPQLTRDHPVTQQIRPAWQPGRADYLDDIGRPLAVRWLVLDRNSPSHGGAERWVPRALDHFQRDGWRTVHDRGGFVVLTR